MPEWIGRWIFDKQLWQMSHHARCCLQRLFWTSSLFADSFLFLRYRDIADRRTGTEFMADICRGVEKFQIERKSRKSRWTSCTMYILSWKTWEKIRTSWKLSPTQSVNTANDPQCQRAPWKSHLPGLNVSPTWKDISGPVTTCISQVFCQGRRR